MKPLLERIAEFGIACPENAAIRKVVALTNEELIQLTEELQQTTVPGEALLRQVIKGTELDTTVPLLAFTAIGSMCSWVLAERLLIEIEKSNHAENNTPNN